MRLRVSLIAGIGALLLFSATARQSRGVEANDVVGKIEALNRAALASFHAREYDKARSQLNDALALGKSNELHVHPIIARTYLHLGVVYLEGFKDKDRARAFFEFALRLRPSIEVTPSLASDDVILEFEDARTT